MDSSTLLPAHVVLPDDSMFAGEYFVHYLRYVRGTLEHLADKIELTHSTSLKRPDWSAFEVLVDDQVVVIDFSDFSLISTSSSAYRHWLRFHHTPSLEPFPNLGSFPPWSFMHWGRYEELLRRPAYTALGEQVIYRHGDIDNRESGVGRRRSAAGDILRRDFPDRVVTGFVAQEEFFDSCLRSALVVHIPGSHPHILDRTVQQMFGLGVCVISPDLWTTCLETRPVAGEHYLLLRDDFSNLPELVHWALANRDQCRQIGRAAQAFFQRQCTPMAIWNYICRRLLTVKASAALERTATSVAAANG